MSKKTHTFKKGLFLALGAAALALAGCGAPTQTDAAVKGAGKGVCTGAVSYDTVHHRTLCQQAGHPMPTLR